MYDEDKDNNSECDGISIETCLSKVESSFDLALIASQRAFSILDGDYITVPNAKEKNKSIVVALKEIANDNLDMDSLKFALACRMASINSQKYTGMKFRNDSVDDADLEEFVSDVQDVKEDAGEAVASIGISHTVKSMSGGGENMEYDSMSLGQDEESIDVFDLTMEGVSTGAVEEESESDLLSGSVEDDKKEDY